MSAHPTSPSPAAGAPSPRWERRKEHRPAELLAAALDLFVERGYAATRLEDIAARAGVSKGTLYLYFATKEELFKALVRENIVSVIERVRQRIAGSDEPAAVLVERFVQGWWREFGGTRLAGIVKLLMSEAGNFPEVARFFHDEAIRPTTELFGSIIARGVARGEFRPVDVQAAAQLWLAPLVMKAIWTQSFELCRISGDSLEPGRLIATHLQMILAGLRPEPR